MIDVHERRRVEAQSDICDSWRGDGRRERPRDVQSVADAVLVVREAEATFEAAAGAQAEDVEGHAGGEVVAEELGVGVAYSCANAPMSAFRRQGMSSLLEGAVEWNVRTHWITSHF